MMLTHPYILDKHREQTNRFAASPSITASKRCSKCGITKAIYGGVMHTALGGRVTRYNPTIFVCRDCKGDEE